MNFASFNFSLVDKIFSNFLALNGKVIGWFSSSFIGDRLCIHSLRALSRRSNVE